MNPNATRVPDDEPADSHRFSVRRHLLILTFAGAAAIAISLLASSGSRAPATAAATLATMPSGAPAQTAASTDTPAQIAGHSSGSADQAFDYFPAQFPTPSGEFAEQPPTF